MRNKFFPNSGNHFTFFSDIKYHFALETTRDILHNWRPRMKNSNEYIFTDFLFFVMILSNDPYTGILRNFLKKNLIRFLDTNNM